MPGPAIASCFIPTMVGNDWPNYPFKFQQKIGPEESRTPYPLLAKQTLYQMSYRP